MKLEFTREEARRFLQIMADDNDVVRLVDPEARRTTDADGNPDADCCHAFWGRCERCENCTSLRALQNRGQFYKMEIRNGRTYWVCSRFLSICGRPEVAEIVQDVTDSLIMDSDQRDRLGTLISGYNQMLVTDSLTGVYNRRFLDEHFLPSLKCCHEEGIAVNLAFIDMDGFKRINDTYGHRAGDRLLKDVAGFWKLHFNSREKNRERLVIRFGGDEIMILACGVALTQFEEEIRRYDGEMRKICYYSESGQFPFNFTIGVASSEQLPGDWSWDELIDLADRRMYRGKMGAKAGTEGREQAAPVF